MNMGGIYHYDTSGEARGSKYHKIFPSEPRMHRINIVYKSSARIFLIEDYMTNELAALLFELNPIFISDIRTNENEEGDFPSGLDFIWNMAM